MRVRCPSCGRPAAWEDNPHRPFCSKQCKLIDLGKWLDEKYRIPGEIDESEGAPAEEVRDSGDPRN